MWIAKPPKSEQPRSIVVATDFSEVADRAVEYAVSMSALVGSNLQVVHSAEPPRDHMYWKTQLSFDQLTELRQQALHDAESKLDGVRRRASDEMVDASIHLKLHEPDEAILQAIENYNAGLLVMGTIARGAVSGLFVGNTAERLLPQVPCSVLVAKPDNFICPVEIEEANPLFEDCFGRPLRTT